MRTVDCMCGGTITAPSLKASAPYVEAHNTTMLHRMWRAIREPWTYSFDLELEKLPCRIEPYDDPRRRPTAGSTSVDLSGSRPGTSTDGEGT